MLFRSQRFPHAVMVPAALLDVDDADERIGRVDQIKSHRFILSAA